MDPNSCYSIAETLQPFLRNHRFWVDGEHNEQKQFLNSLDWKNMLLSPPPIGCSDAVLFQIVDNYREVKAVANEVPLTSTLEDNLVVISKMLGFQPNIEEKKEQLTVDQIKTLVNSVSQDNNNNTLIHAFKRIKSFAHYNSRMKTPEYFRLYERVEKVQASLDRRLLAIQRRGFSDWEQISSIFKLNAIKDGLNAATIAQQYVALIRSEYTRLTGRSGGESGEVNERWEMYDEGMDRDEEEEIRRARVAQLDREINASDDELIDEEFVDEVPGYEDRVQPPSLRPLIHSFNSGKMEGKAVEHFQLFLLDDVEKMWGDNPPFKCGNEVDMITQDDIQEPIAANRIMIAFPQNSFTTECWDMISISCYVASQLAANQIPRHPVTREPFNRSTLALLGFVHGILRENNRGPGVGKEYVQQIFDKFKAEHSTVMALEVKEAVQGVLDNPTIAFKQMLCERKVWYDNNETPKGLCSAKPLKDFIDFQQYERDLFDNISRIKSFMAPNDRVIIRKPAEKRPSSTLPDVNPSGQSYRRVHESGDSV